jgi:hypothetical protein
MTSWPTIGFLAAAVSCGAIDAAAWAIPAAALSLTGMRIEAMSPVVDKYAAAIGRVEAWGLFLGAAFLGNVVASAVAFLAGKVLAAVL